MSVATPSHAKASPLQHFRQRLEKAWDWLTRPSEAIQDAEQRRRARLLASLLAPLFVLAAMATVGWATIGVPGIATPFSAGLIAIAYVFSRTRYHVFGTWLVAGSIILTTFVQSIADANLGNVTVLPISIVLGSLLLSPRQTIVLGAVNVASVILLVAVLPEWAFQDVFILLLVLPACTTLVVISSNLRERHLAQIEGQTTQLTEQNLALAEAYREQAIARRQAAEANRLKSEFLATMSHELRTPLNAMIGYTEIMLAGMSGILDNEAVYMTERVHDNSQRLLTLINNVLDLSKVQAQRLEIVPHPFSVRDMAESLHAQTKSLADTKGLAFEYRIDPELPDELVGDEELIERITLNLLSNAFKFTERGRIVLAMSHAGDSTWTISVTDTGIGIPPHALEYIFDPFRQIDGSSNRAYSGSGLGLSIVRELTRAMDGTVQVRSRVGQGSVFTVTLPLVVAGQSAKELESV